MLFRSDLDLQILATDATSFEPYLLNPGSPNSPPSSGDNFRDNVEMVHIPAPGSGMFFFVKISHKGTLSGGSQSYSLIISGNTDFDYVMARQAGDDASNYSQSDFVAEGNLGQGLGDWYAAGSGGGFFRGPAAEQGSNSATLDTEGNAFGLWAGTASFQDIGRLLGGDLPDGHRLSFSLAYRYDNGNKGFSICNGSYATEVFNWNVNSSGYTWTGGGNASSTPWTGFRENGVAMDFYFVRSGNLLEYSFSSPAGGGPSGSGSMAVGGADRGKFYISEAGGGAGGNLYFNSLRVDPVASPVYDTWILQGSVTL